MAVFGIERLQDEATRLHVPARTHLFVRKEATDATDRHRESDAILGAMRQVALAGGHPLT